jgi:phosphotransferase family enzyme
LAASSRANAETVAHSLVPSSPNDSGAYPAHAWLAGVLPAGARRFRVSDPALAETLREAGANLVEKAADVEITALSELQGEAPVVIVSINASAMGPVRLVRAGKRLVNSLRVLAQATLARRAIRARGYPSTVVIRWDVLQALRLPWLGESSRSRRLIERLPQRALVVGRKSEHGPTLLEAAVTDASSAGDLVIAPHPPLVRGGVLVLVGADAVLRVAVGPSRQEIDRQVAALKALHAADVPATVADRVPLMLGRGRSGLADWSLERRLPGATPSRDLSDPLLGECVDFLVDLHSVRGSDPDISCASLAETLAELCAPELAPTLRDIGDSLDSDLAGLPRGFGHADFGRGNLLAEGNRLVGVIDWDGAGPGRLPLLSLLHLRLGAEYAPQDDEWGHTIVSRLLPWAESGGDEIAQDYCRRVGFEPHPTPLRELALAFWLHLVTLHLRLHPFRRDDQRWITRNIDAVIRSLAQR